MNGRARSAARFGSVVVALLSGVAATPAPLAAAATATYPAAITAESWYRGGAADRPALPPCGLPAVGCAPVPDVTPPNQYPTGTLHVGVAAGAEDSRTYLTLVSSSVPFDQAVTGGTLTLPVLTETESGTVAPETASLRACLVAAPVKNGVEGAAGGAPAADCKTASAARFAAAQGSVGPQFVIDLAPFAQAFAIGEVSLALVPGEEPGTAWHVAMSRSDRAAEGSRPITAQLRTGTADEDVEPTLPSDDEFVAGPPPLSGGSAEVPPLTPGLEDAPALPTQVSAPAPEVSGAPVPAPRVFARPVAALSDGDLPVVVLLVPLLVVGAATWVSRVFTRELLPTRG